MIAYIKRKYLQLMFKYICKNLWHNWAVYSVFNNEEAELVCLTCGIYCKTNIINPKVK